MANIRNQNSWVHQKEPEAATAKAKDQLRMAVAKVSRDYALERGAVEVIQKALVVGGGVAGLTAALELGEFALSPSGFSPSVLQSAGHPSPGSLDFGIFFT